MYFCQTIRILMRFLGNIDARLDTKSRVFVPAPFRRLLQAEGQLVLYLRKDIFEDCLVLYPEDVWEAELGKLRKKLSKWKPEQQAIFRQYTHEAIIVEMDANGRILIPKALLDACGINSDVVFLGVDDTLELWDKATLEKTKLPAEAFRAQIVALMDGSDGTDD